MKRGSPLIFDIHRFALDDGPGIRTTVFLKGCPLSCAWCHNPESMRPDREIASHPDRCIRCGACSRVCREAAVLCVPDLRIDRNRCSACGSCAEVCPSSAVQVVGNEYPLEELLELILRDRQLFDASGGGVTFSGGEPTIAMEYLSAALKALKSEGVHTAIQTCGMFDYPVFSERILPYVDLIMFDIKLIDPDEHRKYTGRDNRPILENLRRLSGVAGSMTLPRVPLIPGITAKPDNLLGIAALLADLGYARCDLLTCNPAGVRKRESIGMPPSPDLPETNLSPAEENKLRLLFNERLMQRIETAA